MNRKLGILSLFLSVLFAGCSSEDPAANEGGENNGKDLGYIAVNIVQPGTVTGRSVTVPEGTSSGDFVAGDEEENFANDATFIIYKISQDESRSRTYLSTQTIPLEATSQTGSNPAVEKIYSAVLVIDADDELKKPSTNEEEPRFAGIIYCVLNAPKEIKEFDGSANRSEKTLQEFIDNYGSAMKGSFIMSNSTYRDYTDGTTTLSTDITCGTQFTTNDYYTTPNEALQDPVDIYVERVVARVDTKRASTFSNEKPDPFGTNEDSKKLTIRITGMEIANIATKSYLFKNVDGRNVTGSGWPIDWDDLGLWDATNKRCYWETVPTLTGGDYENQSYTAIVGAGTHTAADAGEAGETGGSTEKNVYDEFSDFNENFYIQPNTSDNKTAVLVTAQLLDKDNEPADLVWIKGGYFTNTGALKLVCSHLKAKQWAIKEITAAEGTTTYRNIEPDDLEWARYVDPDAATKILLNSNLKDYQAIAQVRTLPSGSFICKASDVGTDVVKEIKKMVDGTEKSYEISDLNGASVETDDGRLASETSLYAEVFKNGMCYYFVNIDQTGVFGNVTPTLTKYEGVVRNHIYELTLSSIKGIGTAVFDPEQTIIPVKPPHDEFYHLAARINVLPWKLVKQNVSFEGN